MRSGLLGAGLKPGPSPSSAAAIRASSPGPRLGLVPLGVRRACATCSSAAWRTRSSSVRADSATRDCAPLTALSGSCRAAATCSCAARVSCSAAAFAAAASASRASASAAAVLASRASASACSARAWRTTARASCAAAICACSPARSLARSRSASRRACATCSSAAWRTRSAPSEPTRPPPALAPRRPASSAWDSASASRASASACRRRRRTRTPADPDPPGRPTRGLPGQHLAPPEPGQRRMQPGHQVRRPSSTPALSPPTPPAAARSQPRKGASRASSPALIIGRLRSTHQDSLIGPPRAAASPAGNRSPRFSAAPTTAVPTNSALPPPRRPPPWRRTTTAGAPTVGCLPATGVIEQAVLRRSA